LVLVASLVKRNDEVDDDFSLADDDEILVDDEDLGDDDEVLGDEVQGINIFYSCFIP
jgi:hypothetical protein